MLDRKEVKEGLEYRIDGKPWFVWMIHKPGNGESVTITSEGYSDVFYERLRAGKMQKKYMQMRKFQKAATLVTPSGSKPC